MVGKWLMYGEGLNTVNCEYREATQGSLLQTLGDLIY